MGGKAAVATVAAAGVYTGGRIITNALSWFKSAAVVAAQAALLKKMLDKQKKAYDDIAAKQRNYVEHALNDYLAEINNTLLPTFADAYPNVPVAAPFAPVDPSVEAFQTMVGNIASIPKTQEYIQNTNYLLHANYMARMTFLDASFFSNVKLEFTSIKALLRGEMPTDEVVRIVGDQAEQDMMLGRVGGSGRMTLRNLGISRMNAQAAGRSEHHALWGALNRDVMPLATEATLDQQMLKPEYRIGLALQQAQLIQNSLQNINNTAAQKPPFRLAVLQTKIQTAIARLTYEANKGNMVNNFVPNYSAVLGPAMSNLFNGIQQQIGSAKDNNGELMSPGGHPGEGGSVIG